MLTKSPQILGCGNASLEEGEEVEDDNTCANDGAGGRDSRTTRV